MEYPEIIQNSIDYIEENLKTEIPVQELADRANFSLYYYYRLFHAAVGMPVKQYIVRRKLLHAIYEISRGNPSVDVALAYGFDTYAGFYKAWKREFGCTPKQYLKEHPSKKPYKIILSKEDHPMITHKRITRLLERWGLQNERITDIYYENGEQNEHAFSIGDKYTMKCFSKLSKANTCVDISRAVDRVGLSAATPIETMDGEIVVTDGSLYFVLTNRLHGERIKVAELYQDDGLAKARSIGEMVGQLSLALKQIDVLVDDISLYDSVVNWALPKVKNAVGLPERLCKALIHGFGERYSRLPRQIIHRDPNPGNLIVANEQWGFLDFDLSEKNVRIFDPCYAATAILSESFDETNPKQQEAWIAIYQNIIRGYDSVAKLSEDEIEAIPTVVLSIQLICCAWFADQEKYRQLFSINCKMTRWLCEHFDQLSVKSLV